MATCQIRLLVNSDLLVWHCLVSRDPSGRQLPPGVAAEEKIAQICFAGFEFCPIWTKTYLEGVKQVLALFAPPTLLAKHPSLEKHNQCRSFNTKHPYYLFPMRQRDCTAPAVCGHRNCQKKSLVRIADISPIEQPEILSRHLSLV